jgi:hypothetical protein
MYFRVYVVISLLASVALNQHSHGEDKLISFITMAHKTTRDSYVPTYCKLRFEKILYDSSGNITVKQFANSQSWHAPEAVRMTAIDDNEGIDYVIKDSIQMALLSREKNGKEQYSASKNSYPYRYLHRGDAWVRSLLVLSCPGKAHSLEFEKLIALSSKATAKREVYEGNNCIIVSLSFPQDVEHDASWTVEVIFDESVNYLVRKVTHTIVSSSGVFTRYEKVTQFSEVKKGLYFPVSCEGKAHDNGTLRSTCTADFSEVSIHKHFTPDTFKMKFPVNVILSDGNQGIAYRVDANGNQNSQSIPLSNLLQPDPDGSITDGVITSMKWSWGMPSLAVCLLLLGFIAYKEWLGRSARVTQTMGEDHDNQSQQNS